MKLNQERIFKELTEILVLKSPTGNTKKGIEYVNDKFKEIGLDTRYTNKGALIATMTGSVSESIVVASHIDTLGCMVKEITSNGMLTLTQLGGYAWATVEGEYVEVETISGKYITGTILTTLASSHVHGAETNNTLRSEKTLVVRLDEEVFTKEDVVKLGINVGDFVHLDPKTTVTKSGYIKSRHLDDKACVIASLEMARYFKDNNIIPSKTIHFFISNYEEVGHGASAAIPEDATEMLALDMAAMGAGQTSDEYSVTICVKDSSGPYDLDIKNKLVHLAKENDIPFALDIYPFYGSDGSAALRAGNDIRVGLIGPGVDASHSYERTHIKAIEATIELGVAYLK